VNRRLSPEAVRTIRAWYAARARSGKRYIRPLKKELCARLGCGPTAFQLVGRGVHYRDVQP